MLMFDKDTEQTFSKSKSRTCLLICVIVRKSVYRTKMKDGRRRTVSRYRSAALGSTAWAGTGVASSSHSSSKTSDCFAAEAASGPSASILARLGGRSWFANESVS